MRTITFSVVSCLLAATLHAQQKADAPTWGGDHVRMTVTGSGAMLEFDCATGEIPGRVPLAPAAKFNRKGSYIRGHFGPTRLGDESSTAAEYSGTVQGDVLHLEVRNADGHAPIGDYTLTRGAPGRVRKCE